MKLFRTACPFHRVATAMEWHPTKHQLIAVGSKGGDILLWNTLEQNLQDPFIEGVSEFVWRAEKYLTSHNNKIIR
jgi:hypothetical protein